MLSIALLSPSATTLVRPQRPGIPSTVSVPIHGGRTACSTEPPSPTAMVRIPRRVVAHTQVSIASVAGLSAVMILRGARMSVLGVEGELLGCINLVFLKFLEEPFIGQIQGV